MPELCRRLHDANNDQDGLIVTEHNIFERQYLQDETWKQMIFLIW